MSTWSDLLSDVEAQAEVMADREQEARADEQARHAWTSTGLIERFEAAQGEQVQIMLGAAGPIRGVVMAVGPDWVLVSDPGAGHEHLVRLQAVSVVTGLGARAQAAEPSRVLNRLDAAWALRRLARDRSFVRVRTLEGVGYGGVLDRVAADHLDLVEELEMGLGERARSTVVALAAVAVVTRT
jgi:hypothetical protein